MKETTRRILLTHWNAGVFDRAGLTQLLPELAIYALLYDEVLIREEDLITNRAITRLLMEPENFRFFEELLSAGLVKLLRLPPGRYPAHRRFDALTQPVSARAEEHSLRRTYKGRPWNVTRAESQLFRQLDSILANEKTFRFQENFPSENAFANELAELLENRDKYRHPILRHVTPAAAEALTRFCREPEAWLRFLHDAGVRSPIVGPDGGFYRSAVYQCSEFLPARQTVRRLAESVYAATACDRENSDGRYGGSKLIELPFRFDDLQDWSRAREEIVSIEVMPTAAVATIAFGPGVAEILGRTRESKAFRDLQRALGELAAAPASLLPTESTFRDAWLGVAEAFADESARMWASTSLVSKRTVAYSLWLYKLARIVGFRFVPELLPALDLAVAADEVVTRGIEHFGTTVMQSLRAVWKHPSIRTDLMGSASVRCSRVVLSRQRSQPRPGGSGTDVDYGV